MQNPHEYNNDHHNPNESYSNGMTQSYPNEPVQSYPNESTSSSPSGAAQPHPNKPTRSFSSVSNQPFPISASTGRRSSSARGFGTAGILTLLFLLVSVFGIGLFAGWQFSNRNGAPRPGAGMLQPGTTPLPTIPSLTGDNAESVR